MAHFGGRQAGIWEIPAAVQAPLQNPWQFVGLFACLKRNTDVIDWLAEAVSSKRMNKKVNGSL